MELVRELSLEVVGVLWLDVDVVELAVVVVMVLVVVALDVVDRLLLVSIVVVDV